MEITDDKKPDVTLTAKVVFMALNHLPEFPKVRRYEGRKKVRGYMRKRKSCRKDTKRFCREIPNAVSNFLCDFMENILIGNIKI